MVTHYPSASRGQFRNRWLNSKHSFSFGEFYDPSKMGFSVLRVINEDRIAASQGFEEHPHRDMEIISYVLSGSLEHRDSMGNSTLIRPGEVQRMSAGTGVRHSEFNHEKDQETHFLQIWIVPNQLGLAPSYAQRSFDSELKTGKLVRVATGRTQVSGPIWVHQDVELSSLRSETSGEDSLVLDPSRWYWIQMISGNLHTREITLTAGDALGVQKESLLQMKWDPGTHLLVFDLPSGRENR